VLPSAGQVVGLWQASGRVLGFCLIVARVPWQLWYVWTPWLRNKVHSALQKGGLMKGNEQVHVVLGPGNYLAHPSWWKFHGTDGNGKGHPWVVTRHPRSELIVERYNRNLTKREPCAQLRMADDLVSHEDKPKLLWDLRYSFSNIALTFIRALESSPVHWLKPRPSGKRRRPAKGGAIEILQSQQISRL